MNSTKVILDKHYAVDLPWPQYKQPILLAWVNDSTWTTIKLKYGQRRSVPSDLLLMSSVDTVIDFFVPQKVSSKIWPLLSTFYKYKKTTSVIQQCWIQLQVKPVIVHIQNFIEMMSFFKCFSSSDFQITVCMSMIELDLCYNHYKSALPFESILFPLPTKKIEDGSSV